MLSIACVLGCTTHVGGGPGFGSGASGGAADEGDTGDADDDGDDGGGPGGDAAEEDGSTSMPGESGADSNATGSGGPADESGSGDAPDDDPGDPNCAGGCATGQDWEWDGIPAPPQPYVDGAVLEGPMPPTQGGGSGHDPSGTPVVCYGGGFGEYSDNASFCAYVANRFRYLEAECGNFNTAFLTEDAELGSIAQTEAEAVADGQCPRGEQGCGNWAEMLYLDGWDGDYLSRDAMFTAPESSMMVSAPQSYTPGYEEAFPAHACQFTGEYANIMLYHYCIWEGTNNPVPSTQPSRVGCGTAVDTDGVTWRVVKLGA